MRRVLLAVLGLIAASAVGADPPIDERLAAFYAEPSPFESVAHDLWIAESENAYVIRDHKPQAPVHLLVIPKRRVPTLLQAPPELLGEMLNLARTAAEQEGIARSGFRIVINTHPEGGQSVYHLHMHVLGARQMKWPPG